MNVSLSDIFSSFSHIVTYPLWSSNCLCVEKLLAIQKKGDKTSTSNNLRLFGVCIERLWFLRMKIYSFLIQMTMQFTLSVWLNSIRLACVLLSVIFVRSFWKSTEHFSSFENVQHFCWVTQKNFEQWIAYIQAFFMHFIHMWCGKHIFETIYTPE